MIVIEDDLHGEPGEEFATREEAVAELRRRAALPWNEPPNQAPCTSWRTCGRSYALVEYDTRFTPWRRLSSVPILEVSKKGATWFS